MTNRDYEKAVDLICDAARELMFLGTEIEATLCVAKILAVLLANLTLQYTKGGCSLEEARENVVSVLQQTIDGYRDTANDPAVRELFKSGVLS